MAPEELLAGVANFGSAHDTMLTPSVGDIPDVVSVAPGNEVGQDPDNSEDTLRTRMQTRPHCSRIGGAFGRTLRF